MTFTTCIPVPVICEALLKMNKDIQTRVTFMEKKLYQSYKLRSFFNLLFSTHFSNYVFS